MTCVAIPEKEIMDFIGELFKGFADPTRVHILYLLADRELCVSDIAEQVELSQSAISHQLRYLVLTLPMIPIAPMAQPLREALKKELLKVILLQQILMDQWKTLSAMRYCLCSFWRLGMPFARGAEVSLSGHRIPDANANLTPDSGHQ